MTGHRRHKDMAMSQAEHARQAEARRLRERLKELDVSEKEESVPGPSSSVPKSLRDAFTDVCENKLHVSLSEGVRLGMRWLVDTYR